MKIKITPTQTQNPILAPSMQQSIEVLLLPVAELSTAIEQELQNNPLLEVDEEERSAEQIRFEEIINLNYKLQIDSTNVPFYDLHWNDDDNKSGERPLSKSVPLEDYLLQQLRFECSDPLELKIGEFIIGNLDEDGYFQSTCEEIAQLLGLEHTRKAEEVLHTIQNLDPVGIASRNLQECLLIQTHYKLNGSNDLMITVIRDYFQELGRKKFVEIGRKLKIPMESVKEIAKEISGLEPRPARNYRPVDVNIYIKPDITIIENEEGNYQIKINQDNIPPLRINSYYQKLLAQPNRTEEELVFIREKMKNALLFMKSIQQRHQTINEIAQYIVDYQKDFFEQGYGAIKPMTLKDIAKSINRNESTVSRAINQKYMDTPRGLFPLKFFFSQAVPEGTNGSVSSRSVKEEIKTLIEAENTTKPLSDQEIYHYLAKKGMKVARRTISKYRQTLRILPSHLRKI